MPFVFKQCFSTDNKPIEGLQEISPSVFQDDRGYFFESYHERDFAANGIDCKFVQDNQSKSCKGVLRGLHFQNKHPQGKLVRVIQGEVFDVAVDIRKNSKTFGKWYGSVLNPEKQNQLFIPSGFAHGFLVLSDVCVFVYKCTDFYYAEDQGGIIYNDPEIGVKWPKLDIEYILSKKDKELKGLSL